MMEMTLLQKIQSVQSAVSVVALLVGGAWAYNEFIRERPDRARAEIEIASIQRLALSSDKILIRTDVRISNSGRVQIQIDDVLYKIEQVLPACDSERDVPPGCYRDPMLDADVHAKDRNASRINWPDIAVFRGNVGGKMLLEPGEGQSVEFEFIVPADVQAVRVFAYIQNEALCTVSASKKRNDAVSTGSRKNGQDRVSSECIGWTASALYDVRGPATSIPSAT